MSDYKLSEILERIIPSYNRLSNAYSNIIGHVDIPKNVKRHVVFMMLSNICNDVASNPTTTRVSFRYNGTVIKELDIPPSGIQGTPPVSGCAQPTAFGPDYKNDIICVDGVIAGDKSIQAKCIFGGGVNEGVFLYLLYWDEVMV